MRFKATSRRDFSKPRIRGLGDLVHLATAPVRAVFPKLNDCPACKERRRKLNTAVPL